MARTDEVRGGRGRRGWVFFPSLYLLHLLIGAFHCGEGLSVLLDTPAQRCVSYLIPDPIKLTKFSHHTHLEYDLGSTFFFLTLPQRQTLKLRSPDEVDLSRPG